MTAEGYGTRGPRARFALRYRLVATLAAGSMINFVDRVNISVTAPVMIPALGWDEAQFGLVFSAFLFGYTLFQFPGGVLADRWNARWTITLSCVGFSLFTALTPIGATAVVAMLAVRFTVGLFESVSFPSFAALNSRWIPRHEYGRAQTVSLSGSMLGQALSYPLMTWLMLAYGWPSVFYVNAALGLAWAMVFFAFARNTPAEHPWITPEELEVIEENRARPLLEVQSPWAVLRLPQVWWLSLAYLSLVFGFWMVILWFPTYLVKARGFSVESMGWIGVIPTIAGFVGAIGGGTLSDVLLRRGFAPRVARAQAPALGVLLGVPAVVAAALVPWGWASVACLATYMLLANLGMGACWAVPVEIDSNRTGSISGVMQTAGNAAGIFGPMVAGFLVKATGDWLLPFVVNAAAMAIGVAVLFFFVRPEQRA